MAKSIKMAVNAFEKAGMPIGRFIEHQELWAGEVGRLRCAACAHPHIICFCEGGGLRLESGEMDESRLMIPLDNAGSVIGLNCSHCCALFSGCFRIDTKHEGVLSN